MKLARFGSVTSEFDTVSAAAQPAAELDIEGCWGRLLDSGLEPEQISQIDLSLRKDLPKDDQGKSLDRDILDRAQCVQGPAGRVALSLFMGPLPRFAQPTPALYRDSLEHRQLTALASSVVVAGLSQVVALMRDPDGIAAENKWDIRRYKFNQYKDHTRPLPYAVTSGIFAVLGCELLSTPLLAAALLPFMKPAYEALVKRPEINAACDKRREQNDTRRDWPYQQRARQEAFAHGAAVMNKDAEPLVRLRV